MPCRAPRGSAVRSQRRRPINQIRGTPSWKNTVIISPFAKRHYVDHTQYETAVIALIEKRYNLKPLGRRDAAANPFSNAFNF
ncbi:MAG TPA: hypothetical protein VHX17_09540 [Candidatus Cybelea sp.]|nr:hypothetical protein [Candidatus Cybelea sp.]